MKHRIGVGRCCCPDKSPGPPEPPGEGCDWNFIPNCPTSWNDINGGVVAPPYPDPNCGFYEEQAGYYAADGQVYLTQSNSGGSAVRLFRRCPFNTSTRAEGQTREWNVTTNMAPPWDTLPNLILSTRVDCALLESQQSVVISHSVEGASVGTLTWDVVANDQVFSGAATTTEVWRIVETLVTRTSAGDPASPSCQEDWNVQVEVYRNAGLVTSFSRPMNVDSSIAQNWADLIGVTITMVGRDVTKWPDPNHISAMSYDSP